MLNEKILNFVQVVGIEQATNLVHECFNCKEASIDECGDIRIAKPQSGHWLSNDEKERFIEFVESR